MKQKNIIIKPLITEKSMSQSSANRYVFKVARAARKSQIKTTVEEAFNVDVIKIHTLKLAGKRRRVGRLRREIQKPVGKKAIVTIKPGQKIEVFESQG